MFNFLSDTFIFSLLLPIAILGGALLLMYWFIPKPWIKFKIPALLLGIGCVLFSTFYYGKQVEFTKNELIRQKDLAKIKELELASEKINTKVVVEYVDRIRVIEKERKVYVDRIQETFNPEIVADYPIPNAFVRVLDDSAEGKIPESTGTADGVASEIKINEAATYISENYDICRMNAERLQSLQNWIKFQQKVFESD